MMSINFDKLDILKDKGTGYWADRILSQIRYATKISIVNDGKYDSLIDDTIQFLHEKQIEEGNLTIKAAQQAESMLKELSETAKGFQMMCVAHAHIDMNWLWGYAETVAITLDTFKTILNLMKEYPDFKFSQSQAAVYKIVEEFNPKMLEEIKLRVKEGRWEVTASTWVETDKNMPNGESLARHVLYTKRYLSKLLDLEPDLLQLDFEPDTFGHNENVPEILAKGGVKYYYHCRGSEEHNIYRWQAPSGSSVLSYREPLGYSASIDGDIALIVPEFCTRHGINSMLKVYGVGDHGGGPTRRDLERLLEMNHWPVFPTIKFSTFGEFFRMLDGIGKKLPVVEKEINFVFTGCYTTQARIKLANRISEAKLYNAEAYSALSTVFTDGIYPEDNYRKAWERVLFNHFHDILPGSGVIETREYAMGQFQQVLAAANTGISLATRNIASQIDTSTLPEDHTDNRDSKSEGAGVGFAIYDYGVPQAERGKGKNRIIHFFNPSSHERSEPVEVVIWDWPGDKMRIEVIDVIGKEVKHQLIEGKSQQLHPAGKFWGHEYMRLLLNVKVPPYGYSTYLLKEHATEDIKVEIPTYQRVEKIDEYILENNYIRVVMDTHNASIISMTDKKTGNELIDAKRSTGIFRLIEEDDYKGMTAWQIGRYINIYNLNCDVKIKNAFINKNQLRQWISYRILFRSSRLDVTVSLDSNSTRLNFDVECDWQEIAQIGKFIPQLNFHMPFAYRCKDYKYDIPFGAIIRKGMDMDVPANSWGLGLPEEEGHSAVAVITNTKYGFRGVNDSMSISLIRSSYDPDPYPDNGIHRFKFAVELVNPFDNNALIQNAFDYNNDIIFVSGSKHNGTIPASGSFFTLESGSVMVSSVKMSEESNKKGLIIRVYETNGLNTQAVFSFINNVSLAYCIDLNENRLENEKVFVDGKLVRFDVNASSVSSIYIEFYKNIF